MFLSKFRSLFRRNSARYPVVIGMIHLRALPGTPGHRGGSNIDDILNHAVQEACVYDKAGVDGVLIENMRDLPYLRGAELGPEITASMTRVAAAVRGVLPPDVPCGVQVLAGGNREAIAISKACGLQFARCEGYVFSHVADEGWMDGCAGPLLRYRKAIDAEGVSVWADIKKKHCGHAVTNDVSIEETAKAAEFFSADGVIITGESTGCQANPEELSRVKASTNCPVLIGSGVTNENFDKFACADGFIVGSHFKTGSRWDGELEEKRVTDFVSLLRKFRSEKTA